MKVWELKEGVEYVSNLPKQERFVYKIIDGYLHRKEEGIYYKDYTDYNFVKDVNFTEYSPPIDWSKVDVDTKFLVKNKYESWEKRHFAKFMHNKPYFWLDGKTSFTSESIEDISSWDEYVLYTE